MGEVDGVTRCWRRSDTHGGLGSGRGSLSPPRVGAQCGELFLDIDDVAVQLEQSIASAPDGVASTPFRVTIGSKHLPTLGLGFKLEPPAHRPTRSQARPIALRRQLSILAVSLSILAAPASSWASVYNDQPQNIPPNTYTGCITGASPEDVLTIAIELGRGPDYNDGSVACWYNLTVSELDRFRSAAQAVGATYDSTAAPTYASSEPDCYANLDPAPVAAQPIALLALPITEQLDAIFASCRSPHGHGRGLIHRPQHANHVWPNSPIGSTRAVV